MEQGKVYKLSLPVILVFMVFAILMFLLYLSVLKDALMAGSILEALQFTGITLIFPLPIFVYSIYLCRKRKEGSGFYWDDEGVVIDLNGNKVYWEEIESIEVNSGYPRFSPATLIYPHYTHHEKIRIRRKKWMPTTVHTIEWFMIEKPEEYTENLIRAWQKSIFKKASIKP